MPVELLIASPATGKTEYCIRKIRELQSNASPSEAWVLVPDRLQAAAFRQRLVRAGGANYLAPAIGSSKFAPSERLFAGQLQPTFCAGGFGSCAHQSD